jgi:hypothetical protein
MKHDEAAGIGRLENALNASASATLFFLTAKRIVEMGLMPRGAPVASTTDVSPLLTQVHSGG